MLNVKLDDSRVGDYLSDIFELVVLVLDSTSNLELLATVVRITIARHLGHGLIIRTHSWSTYFGTLATVVCLVDSRVNVVFGVGRWVLGRQTLLLLVPDTLDGILVHDLLALNVVAVTAKLFHLLVIKTISCALTDIPETTLHRDLDET